MNPYICNQFQSLYYLKTPSLSKFPGNFIYGSSSMGSDFAENRLNDVAQFLDNYFKFT